MPDLPPPAFPSSAYVGNLFIRPDLIFYATDNGTVSPPKRQSLSVAALTESAIYSDIPFKEFSSKRDIVDLRVKKVLDYMKLLDSGSTVPVMAILYKGNVHIIDGNHRLAAAHYSKVKKIDAYVWDYKKLIGVNVTMDKRSKPFPLVMER